MSHDVFGGSRRRRRWLLPAVVATLVLVAVGLSQLASPTPPLLTEDVRTQMLEVSRRSMTFQDLVERIGSAERVELTTVIDEVTRTIADVREELDAIESPPPELVGVLSILDVALASWSDGTSGFRERLLAAADDEAVIGLSDQLLEDLLGIRAGDRLYAEAVGLLAELDVVQPVSAMPNVAFLPSGYPIGPASQSLIAQAQSPASRLALHASLAIEQVTTVPEWVLDTEDTLVVDVTEELVIRVVVTNAGNAASDASVLSVEVAGGDGSAQSLSTEVPGMAAAEKTTVTFDPLPVTPGRLYSLVVRLALAPGEAETADNSRTLQFRVNEGSTTTTTTGG